MKNAGLDSQLRRNFLYQILMVNKQNLFKKINRITVKSSYKFSNKKKFALWLMDFNLFVKIKESFFLIKDKNYLLPPI